MPSVIGVFDTQDDAESARDSLIGAGFDKDNVRVQSHRSLENQSTGLQDQSKADDEGFMARVGHFFSDLFGGSNHDGHRYAGHYAEHVRRGGSVVVVHVADENRVDAARSALATAGAVDIDRRTEAWREDGYSGFDAESQLYSADEVLAERSRNDGVLPMTDEPLEVGKRQVDLDAVRVVSRSDSGAIELDETKHPLSGSSFSTAGLGSGSGTHTMSWTERNPNAPAYDERMGAADGVASGMSSDDEMAYRYGSTLRSDQRYAGRSSWDDVEADARTDWSQRNPGSNWEQAKAAVRNGWEAMTGRR